MKRWGVRILMLSAALIAVAGLFAAIGSPRTASVQERIRDVAQTVRCPTCVGEDVADSTAPVAEAMRGVIAAQLVDGKTPDQIREWFAERYGDDVLLDPPARGTAWLLWLLPAALIGVAVFAVVSRRGGGGVRGTMTALGAAAGIMAVLAGVWAVAFISSPQPPVSVPDTIATDRNAAMGDISVLEHAVAEDPGDLALRLTLARALDDVGRTRDAVEHYAAAVRLAPLDTDTAYLYASALARSGSLNEAMPVLDAILVSEPEHAPSLLLAGTMLWRDGENRGVAMLERFLELQPDHPAAPQVQELLLLPPGSESAEQPNDVVEGAER